MGVTLRGITWNHSRGYVPMVATAQRFCETHPGIEILWEKRSLQEFADAPIQNLVEKYDLLVIDHPWAGYAASHKVLIPFEDYLSAEYLADQAANTVGQSHGSYYFGGSQYALAIDTAAPVACYRADLLAAQLETVPQTWEELLLLARKGMVAVPAIPVDTLMNFYMLCATQGEEPFLNDNKIISSEMGSVVLELLRELINLCTPEVFDWNPIKVYEAMTARDDLLYCPFAYGYSNYARPGYAGNPLVFDDMVTIGNHGKLRSTLGGTGLAIAAKCQNIEIAVEYAAYVASPACQRTVYSENGGQPGHRSAWLDESVNERSGNFYRNTLPGLDRAYLRPRYNGYLHFQDHGGAIVLEYVRNGGNPQEILNRLDRLYRESKGV